MLRALALCLAILPCATRAGDGQAITADEFDAIVTGHTFTWLVDGVPYGVERYAAGRTVLWAFLDDACQEGKWYPRGELICFFYPSEDVEQCWRFALSPSGALTARFFPSDKSPLYTVEESALICPDYSS